MTIQALKRVTHPTSSLRCLGWLAGCCLFLMWSAAACVFFQVTAFHHGFDGIEGDESAVSSHCTSTGNGDNGIEVGESSFVANNTSSLNDNDGFRTDRATVVTHCVASGNDRDGTITGAFSFIQSNTVYNSGLKGIELSDTYSYQVTSNSLSSNGRRNSSDRSNHGIRASPMVIILTPIFLIDFPVHAPG